MHEDTFCNRSVSFGSLHFAWRNVDTKPVNHAITLVAQF